jgi:hypothetical protein
MVKYLNYLQEKDNNMGVREFKFFHGITIQTEGIGGLIRTLRARWEVEDIENLNTYHAIDAEAELTRILSEEWSNEIDREVIRRINDGNDNLDYFNRWLNIDNRA